MEKNQNLEEMQETTILNPNENDEGNAKKPAKKTIIVSTIAAVVVLAGVGGGYAYASNTTYDSYESQLESAKEADSKLVKTLAEARTLVKATKETDVLDKTMLDSLTKSIKTGDALKGVPTTSHATKWNLWGTTKANTIVADDNTEANDSIDAINKAMRKVNKSKTDKQVKDAKDALDKTVKSAESLYKDSEGKVQDDKTRESLKTAIDTAKKIAENAKSDVKALNAQKDAVANAVKSVNDSKTAKEQADAEAKAKAEAEQSQASSTGSSGMYSNSNTYSGGNGSYSNTGYSSSNGSNSSSNSTGSGTSSGTWDWKNYKDSAGGGASPMTSNNFRGCDGTSCHFDIDGDSQGNMW